jgi:hypothetical protein
MTLSIILALFFNGAFSYYKAESFNANFTFLDLFWCILFGVFVDGLGYYFWGKAKSMAVESKINLAPILSATFILPISSIFLIAIFFKESSISNSWFWLSLILVFLGNTTVRFSNIISNIFINLMGKK